MRLLCRLSLAIWLCCSQILQSQAAEQTCGISLHWQAEFNANEQQKLRDWLCFNAQASASLLGPWPFVVEVYLYRRQSTKEPVPWAHTQRGDSQQLHFYVDPRFSLTAFRQDWTAAHEFSHLALPLLPKSELWFAEGFASFMQAQVQQLQQVTAAEQFYAAKIQQHKSAWQLPQPWLPQLPALLKQRRYPAAYWGSALWFMQLDQRLRSKQSSLAALISQYQQQGRLHDQTLSQLIQHWQQLAPAIGIADLWSQYQQHSTAQIFAQHPLHLLLLPATPAAPLSH